MRRLGLVTMSLAVTTTVAVAADVPITGLKLIVLDKLAAASKAKTVFVAKDAAVTKGTGTDPAQISAVLRVAYDGAYGVFVMGQGPKWFVNSANVAKYVNNQNAPPAGFGAVKVSVIKPGLLVKVVATSLGGTPLDISSAPTGAVYVVDTVANGAETTRLCTQFAGCELRTIASSTGYKLACKGNSTPDPACTAGISTFSDLGDGTIYDSATDLQWETKTTAVGSGVNAADLHDVDNYYSWSGHCSVTTSKRCQPNLAAETACKAQTDAAYWGDGCEQCVGGEGTCTVAPAITTAWDWLSQVNMANYAGHSDWRLPSESGCNACYTGLPRLSCTSCSAHELETILLSGKPCGATPCIASIFGPTVSVPYWSSSTRALDPTYAWSVDFFTGGADTSLKTASGFHRVRAVRDGP
jgi:hypothetical protein